jgi:hypothetical protein
MRWEELRTLAKNQDFLNRRGFAGPDLGGFLGITP